MATTPRANENGGVSGHHPLFDDNKDKWDKLRDAHEGEDAVKEKGTVYLPATSGMVTDGMKRATEPGWIAYNAYKMRAVFPDLMKDAVDAMLGVMHHKPPVIELPEVMEPLREKATIRNESLEMLLRRINEEQLVTGRCGLLSDMPSSPVIPADGVTAGGKSNTRGELPYLAVYEGEDIINWDDGRRDGIELQNLNMVVLSEGEYERNENFTWDWVNKYRVLQLGDIDVNEPQGQGTYQVGVFRDDGDLSYSSETMTIPSYRGQTLAMVPFTFINSCDIVAAPDNPPLLGLANLVMTIYRGEADYRQSLFMQGQDTLVIVGGNTEDEELRVGAGGRLDLPTGATADYIGVDSQGLERQEKALENDYSRAAQKGGQLMDSVSRERESGDALKIRVAARTATLNQIALTGAFGLQHSLKQIAIWIGADPEQVIVTPNLDFVDDSFKPEDLVKFLTAKTLGAPVSYETIHTWMQDKDITSLDFKEEIRKIEDEEALTLGSTNPEDLEDDDTDEADSGQSGSDNESDED